MKIIPFILSLAIPVYVIVSLTPLSQYVPRQFVFYSACSAEKTYRLAGVDPRFEITAPEVTELLDQAAAVWNRSYGKTLLSYRPDGAVSVTLEYDIRQKLGQEANRLEDLLTDEREALKAKEGEYSVRIAAFQARADRYREEVAAVNARGGATPEEFTRLTAEQADLEKEAAAINRLIGTFNETTRSYNAGVNQYETAVDSFNREIKNRPEEGIYDPADNSIVLYLYTDETDLLHTMIHEFGHALGLGHVDDPDAIMYLYANRSLMLSAEDREELSQLCRDRTYLSLFSGRLRLGLEIIVTYLRAGWSALPAIST